MWAKWLCHPCRLGDPHCFRAGGKIRGGPLLGKVSGSPLPPRGSPPLQSGGQNQKGSTCEQTGYVSPAVSGIPTASERGPKSELAHSWAKWLCHPCRLGVLHRFRTSKKNQKWHTCGESGYVTPAVSEIPTASEWGGKSEVAHLGQSGYVTPAVSGIPAASERGAKSEGANLWAKWLRHPCRLGDPHRFRVGGKIRTCPLVGKVAISPLPSRGSPPLQSGGEKSEVAHLWAKWLCHPCRLRDPERCRAVGKIRRGPLVSKVAGSPLPPRGSPPLQSGAENQNWGP